MATDFTKAPKQIILDLINEKNPSLGLTEELVTFGAPAVYSGAENRNTKLTLAAVEPSSGYSGSRDIFYNRVDISVVPGTRSKVFSLGNAVNISDLIPEINARYGINLTADDYTDAALPTFTDQVPGEEKDFTITITAGSLVWTNSVTLQLQRNDIPLEDAIAENILDGLVWTPV
jgi:hypothetical protein